MKISAFKYLGVLISPIVIFACLNLGGWFTWSGMVYAFLLVPLLDIVLPSSTQNMSKIEEDVAKQSRIYDYMVYMIVPIQYFLVFFIMYKLSKGGFNLV